MFDLKEVHSLPACNEKHQTLHVHAYVYMLGYGDVFFLLCRCSANGYTRTVSFYNTDQYMLVFV